MNAMTATPIARTEVAERDRLKFLPRVAGDVRLGLTMESATYRKARELSEQYDGGFWNYYDLSNGAFYMAPSGDDRFQVRAAYEDLDMSADAFGLTATLMTVNGLAWLCHAKGDHCGTERFTDAYHNLRDFALAHPESAAIMAAID